MGDEERERIASLYRLRQTLLDAEAAMGVATWPTAEKVVFAVVSYAESHQTPASVHDVECHELMSGYSRATLFRALEALKAKGVIESRVDAKDARVHRLFVAKRAD